MTLDVLNLHKHNQTATLGPQTHAVPDQYPMNHQPTYHQQCNKHLHLCVSQGLLTHGVQKLLHYHDRNVSQAPQGAQTPHQLSCPNQLLKLHLIAIPAQITQAVLGLQPLKLQDAIQEVMIPGVLSPQLRLLLNATQARMILVVLSLQDPKH